MREFTIKVKYNIGDKVWVMQDNYPVHSEITQISILGCNENKSGATSNFGQVIYNVNDDIFKLYTEEDLCDTFEELRDRVFSEDIKTKKSIKGKRNE